MKKENRKLIFGVILSGLICGSLGVGASTYFSASDVSYIPNDIAWEVDNVLDAVNDLYKTNDSIIPNLTYEVNNATIIYYLGSGTSYNIKTMFPSIDYTKLSSSNFIVGASSGYFYASQRGYTGSLGRYSKSSSLTISKNYDASTGVLTIGNLSTSFNIDISTANQSLTPFSYLVVGSIN